MGTEHQSHHDPSRIESFLGANSSWTVERWSKRTSFVTVSFVQVQNRMVESRTQKSYFLFHFSSSSPEKGISINMRISRSFISGTARSWLVPSFIKFHVFNRTAKLIRMLYPGWYSSVLLRIKHDNQTRELDSSLPNFHIKRVAPW